MADRISVLLKCNGGGGKKFLPIRSETNRRYRTSPLFKPISAQLPPPPPNRRASANSLCATPSVPAKAGPPGKPPAQSDVPALRRLVSFRPDIGPAELVRALTERERQMLADRSAELRTALRPLGDAEFDLARAEIAAMFRGCRAMRDTGEAAAAVVEVTLAVLREFPLWAISAGCIAIARGEAGLDQRYAPNDAEIASVVRAQTLPYRQELAEAAMLLGAMVLATPEPQERPTMDELKTKYGSNWGLQTSVDDETQRKAAGARMRAAADRTNAEIAAEWGDQPAPTIAGIPISKSLAKTLEKTD